jgi:hypothetical protein
MIRSTQTAEARLEVLIPDGVNVCNQDRGIENISLLITAKAATQEEARAAVGRFVAKLAVEAGIIEVGR